MGNTMGNLNGESLAELTTGFLVGFDQNSLMKVFDSVSTNVLPLSANTNQNDDTEGSKAVRYFFKNLPEV